MEPRHWEDGMGSEGLAERGGAKQAGRERSRRELLAMAGAAAGTMGVAGAPGQGIDQAALPQIGILVGTTYTTGTLEERLDEARAHGFACVQLSMDCAGLPPMPDAIPTGMAERFRRAAEERGLKIASLQGTFNMCHPDAEHRQAGLRRLRVLAEACPAMGTSAIHLCTGTRNRDSMWRRHADNNTPEAWRDMAACIREATEIARQTGVVLAFEPEVNNVVDSARKARRLLDEISSPHLKVTIDPANIFHTGELPRMKEILEEAFALLGKDIALAHAKDLDHDGDAGHKAAGEGLLDYDLYLKLLHAHGFAGPLLLHGLSRAQVPGCVSFVRKKLAALGG
jgi:sugar phosphate isomerase/epimerase